MKRISSILIVLLTFLLSACDNSNANSKSNIIFPANLDERENAIISTTSEQSFVFDYNVDPEYKEVAVWIEKYESGKLVNDKLGHMTTETDINNGTIIFATSNRSDEKQPQAYYIGVGDKGGTSSSVVSDDKSESLENMSIVSGQLTDEKMLKDSEENVLAAISYSDDESSSHSVSNDFYENPKAHMDELNEYSIVYLFKVEFRK